MYKANESRCSVNGGLNKLSWDNHSSLFKYFVRLTCHTLKIFRGSILKLQVCDQGHESCAG